MLSLGAVELLFVSDGAHDLDASAAILPDNGKVQALLFSVVLKFLPGTEIHLQKIVINVQCTCWWDCACNEWFVGLC